MNSKLAYLVVLILLGGCAPHNLHRAAPVEKDLIDQNVVQSPIVKHVRNKRYEQQRSASDIELHFKQFDLLNAPVAIENWESHYVLGEGSKPKWKYKKIAEITVYVFEMNDQVVMDLFRNTASGIGAAAVIDMYRKPLSIPGTAQSYYGGRISPVYAYVYYGAVVREKVPKKLVVQD